MFLILTYTKKSKNSSAAGVPLSLWYIGGFLREKPIHKEEEALSYEEAPTDSVAAPFPASHEQKASFPPSPNRAPQPRAKENKLYKPERACKKKKRRTKRI